MIPVVVAAIALGAFAVGLGDQHVWSYDEARPALVARDVLYGHWLVPHLGGALYPDKPPLFAWLVALLSPRGVSEWSLRLPAAVAAAATVGVTCAIATRVAGGVAGLVAAATLAGSPAFVHWARTGRMESLLVLWIALTFWSALAWLDTTARRHAALAGVWMGLGVLTKGPFALLPVPAVAIARLARRADRVTSRFGVAIGIGATVGVPAGWLALCVIVDPTGLVNYGGAAIQAFTEEIAARRPRPSSFGVITAAAGFFPWTLLVPGAVVLLVRSGRHARRLLALPLAWVAVVGVLLTVVVSPRESYLLMLYPPLAILVGWAWSTAAGRARWLLAAPLGLAVVGCAVVGVAAIATPLSVETHGVGVRLDARFGATLLVVVAIAASATVALARAGRMAHAGVVLGAAVLCAVLLVEIHVYTPAVNRRFPTRTAGGRFARAAPPDATTVLYVDRQRAPALMFYLPQRPVKVRSIADLRARIAGSDGGASILTLLPRTQLEGLQSAGCRPARVAHEDQVNGVSYVLAEFRSGSECPPIGRVAVAGPSDLGPMVSASSGR